LRERVDESQPSLDVLAQHLGDSSPLPASRRGAAFAGELRGDEPNA
jgi:hypothetical protein